MDGGQLNDDNPADPIDVIKTHLQDMWHMPNENYVAGYVDGKDKLDTFLNQYDCICSTTYSVRTSVKKSSASKLKEKRRYGNEDRIFWELSNGQPKIPFMGIPFIVRSSMAKDCQYGPRYYKPKKKTIGIEKAKHRTGNVCSKKKNCPAQIVIREIVIFVDFALPSMSEGNFYRQRKKELIKELRERISIDNLSTVTRFYVQVPLPKAHKFHPLIPNTKLLKNKKCSAAHHRKKIDTNFVSVLSELSKVDYTSVGPESVETATRLLQQAIQTMKTENSSIDLNPASKIRLLENGSQHYSSKKCNKTVLQETQNEPNVNMPTTICTNFPQPVVHHISTFHQYSSTKQTAQVELTPSSSQPEGVFHPFPLPSFPTKTKSHFFHTPLHTVQVPQHAYNTTVLNTWKQF